MQGRRIKRAYGSGSVITVGDAYYGKWRAGTRQVKRKLGPVRKAGSRDGLTKTMAEAELRRLMAAVTAAPVVERVTIEEVGRRLITHLEAIGRKRSTTESYQSYLNIHLAPFFGAKAISKITKDDVEGFVAHCLKEGQSIKSTRNYLGLLHGIFDFAMKREWATGNPVKLIDKPRAPEADADIRFLDQAELGALLRAVPDDDVGSVEGVMYLAAAMTGMRQGELLALRWMDVDWLTRRIRVRQNFVRGQFGTPKSKRSSRSVPMADVLGGELERLYQRSAFKADDDLVLAHPHTGKPMDRSKLLKRYKGALKRAGVRGVRFHDLRHTFGTRMAALGVPMRTLQEWMGHRDFKTTLIYADYAPSEQEADLINAAFPGTNLGTNLSGSQPNSGGLSPVKTGDPA